MQCSRSRFLSTLVTVKTLLIASMLAGWIAGPRVAGAQEPERPRWSVALAYGSGPHTARSGDVYYETSASNTARASAAYNFGDGRFRPVLRAELLTEGPGSDWTDCRPAPNGSCSRDFPAPDGIGAAAGITYRASSKFEIAALAGVGSYDATVRWFVEAEVALAITRHFAATVAARQMTWSEPGLGHHWYRPVYAGIRLQW